MNLKKLNRVATILPVKSLKELTYFESKEESFYKKGIEKLEKRWVECVTLEGNC